MKKVDSVVKRYMTPGTITRVIQKLEQLQEIKGKAPPAVVQQKLQQIARDVQAIKRDLEPQELKLVEETLKLGELPPLEKAPRRVR